MSTHPTQSVYEMVGGDKTFWRIVNRFYELIEADPALRPMFPDDLEPGKKWQFLFLTQYFGGPTRYAEERGHPRLRMRHNPYPIDQTARDHWFQHMITAVNEAGVQEPALSIMTEYFERASTFMVNSMPPPSDGDIPVNAP